MDEILGLAYHRQMGLPVVIFRLFNTVGPRQTGQYGMVVPRFVQMALRGEPLTVYGDGQQTRCFCDVEDSVKAIIGLAECPEAVGKVFNIGSTEEIKILDLAYEVLSLVNTDRNRHRSGIAEFSEASVKGLDKQIVLVPYDKAYEEGFEDMRRRAPDISLIKDTIGWEPQIPLEETLRRVIAFYRAQHSRYKT